VRHAGCDACLAVAEGVSCAFVTVWAGVAAEADAGASVRDALARALEACERGERAAAELRAENAVLRQELAQRDAQIEEMAAELAVLKRLVFGRSSERARPEAPAGDEGGGGSAGQDCEGGSRSRPRGPGARAGADWLRTPDAALSLGEPDIAFLQAGTGSLEVGGFVALADVHVGLRRAVPFGGFYVPSSADLF